MTALEHGTVSGYAYAGCRCDACRAVKRRYDKRYLVDRVRAGGTIRCDAAPSRELIVQLLALDWTYRRIADAIGISKSQVGHIATKATRTSRVTAAAIEELWEDVRPRKTSQEAIWPMEPLRQAVLAEYGSLNALNRLGLTALHTRLSKTSVERIRTRTAEDYCDLLRMHPTSVWGPAWYDEEAA